ncbi:MAG: putative transcription regulator protein MarR family [Sphingomonas bacterium]|jgi:DNA-binding MarR family transcriptional regulator|nr:putative transcription regulator protein MarR family [Sphingomonas bacterium]
MRPHEIDPISNEDLATALRDFYARSSRKLDQAMAEHGASFARTRFLLMIAKEASVRSTDLAAAFGHAPRTVTEAVDGLERDGLVRRTPDPDDRRAKRISITDAGRAVIEETEPARKRFVEEVFGTLTPEERAAMAAMMAKLNARLPR